MIFLAYTDKYVLDLPEGHKFPMIKYELIYEQLLYEGIFEPKHFFEPSLVSEEILLKTHNAHYWYRLRNLELTPLEFRRIGFPPSEKMVFRCRSSAGATLQCAYYALENGASLNIAGGTHHAYADRGEGFSMLNDIAIAINELRSQKIIQRALVVDLDVHQGNGTAKIFENTPEVFTFSMHGKDNYPLRKENSDLDIALPTGTQDKEYLSILAETLPTLIEKHDPEIIFYQAGVDILSTDKIGKLSITQEGCKQRDEIVFSTAKKHNLPIVTVMGGGYSTQIKDIVNAHVNTFRVAQKYYD
ncbi:MAG: histone deacetylase [Bacteroidia bacterium]|nr:histone deacetylase [Bacteroidia bacterium]MDW8347081.1 histone deacetylase [Bacteroidia bacterium]